MPAACVHACRVLPQGRRGKALHQGYRSRAQNQGHLWNWLSLSVITAKSPRTSPAWLPNSIWVKNAYPSTSPWHSNQSPNATIPAGILFTLRLQNWILTHESTGFPLSPPTVLLVFGQLSLACQEVSAIRSQSTHVISALCSNKFTPSCNMLCLEILSNHIQAAMSMHMGELIHTCTSVYLIFIATPWRSLTTSIISMRKIKLAKFK